MHVLYFAYGSCMSPEDLARDVAEFEVVGPALVRGFRLGFTRYSRARRGGVADLVPDLAGVVEGVLYRLPVEQLAALDEREGAPDNYRRDFIAVRTPDGRIHDGVLTYVVADKSSEEIPPHPDYVATIMSGATVMLSPHYVEKIRGHIQQLLERRTTKDARMSDGRARREKRAERERGRDIGRERKQNRSGTDDASPRRRRTDEDRARSARPEEDRRRRRLRVITYRLVRHGRGVRRAVDSRRA